MLAVSGYLIAALLNLASVTPASYQQPAFLHNHSTAVVSLYQTLSQYRIQRQQNRRFRSHPASK